MPTGRLIEIPVLTPSSPLRPSAFHDDPRCRGMPELGATGAREAAHAAVAIVIRFVRARMERGPYPRLYELATLALPRTHAAECVRETLRLRSLERMGTDEAVVNFAVACAFMDVEGPINVNYRSE